jgi:hypothetical protein
VTLGAWLRERSPAPPMRLLARVEESLENRLDGDAAAAPELCIAAAEQLLAELLARPTAGRESALDLLTVDALVTYALEAAASSPEFFPELTASAMTRLAAVAHA